MARMDVKKQEFADAAAHFARLAAEWWFDNGGKSPVAVASAPVEDGTEPLLKRLEAAKMLKVSVSTVDRLARAGDIIPVVITGRAPRYKKEDIERLIRRRQ
jgi:excisionase family DNA binding protein